MKQLVFVAAALLMATRIYAQDYKAYQNYDFVPGDRVVFDDDFRSDKDGEFPAHWKLLKGQAVVNQMNGERVFALTEGNYVEVAPRIVAASYLSDPFTVEFDFYPKNGSYGQVGVFLSKGDDDKNVFFGLETKTENLQHDLSGTFPGGEEKFYDQWHHAALAFTHNQVKCYLDQYRVLSVPDFDQFMPQAVRFGGIGEMESPILLKNVRIATGGGATLIDQLTKNGKIVTHGIQFDVNAAVVKPESMGTVTAIAKALAADRSLKLEIGGHTDGDGDPGRNMTLSQQRADAVKRLLVEQGADASQLAAKGYGASKPVDKNDSPEGKANNRRVEFTKL